MAWSKSEDNGALLVPYSGAFRCPEDSWDAMETDRANFTTIAWEDRKEIAFGRWNGFCTYYYGRPDLLVTEDGAAVPCPRTYLNNLSVANPELLAAYDTSKARPMPLGHQHMYKYLVSTDGWSISSKFDKYLLMGSLVFKAASIRKGFYYDALRPYEHYVPFMVKHKDDLVEAVKWAISHDAEAHKIAQNAFAFARKNLTRRARFCYLFRLITELAKHFKYKPTCKRRKLCIPVVEELKFMRINHQSNHSCNWRVLEVYTDNGNDPIAAPGNSRHFEVRQHHVDPLHWPRDDLYVMELDNAVPPPAAAAAGAGAMQQGGRHMQGSSGGQGREGQGAQLQGGALLWKDAEKLVEPRDGRRRQRRMG
ncbi:hypothetical protein GPECTOR_16g620 [Gonium pectorale]|uniref:Glycosyl transferase CAP10 domain-containing protein n=1 Tax=Gonium pectorale TaxID=33097 RepID=A0A150GKR5_GONPE|nr:hypothetical protein GPECTOR_16g620 [Gonium pectorale]|eukprot:KXZ50446.1 hypothetical protein GPECTOR_16g620 [Gonium pectorale]